MAIRCPVKGVFEDDLKGGERIRAFVVAQGVANDLGFCVFNHENHGELIAAFMAFANGDDVDLSAFGLLGRSAAV